MTNKTNERISRSLIIAWAALLVFVLGILTWIAIAPMPHQEINDEVTTAVDLHLPEAMPVEQYILKDKETKEDTGGSASLSHQPKTQLAKAPLHENTKFGTIPLAGPDGNSAKHLYAAQPNTKTDSKVKVVFIFSDLGRNDALSEKILEATPAGVTLAYLPYSSDLKTKITTARSKGHEILLNIPMEPTDYPHTDTGPNTLLTGLPTENNMERLQWAMAQGHEYVGLMNLQGSLFLSSQHDLTPVLHEMEKRGLLFVEAEASYRSQVTEIAQKARLPHIKSHFVLSECLTPKELHTILIRAEQMAQESGTIVIVAHASPLTTPLLLTWIRKAQEQNYAFLPVSQIASAASAQQKALS